MINITLLKTLRKMNKMTQADVAKKINRSQQAYASYENGTNEPDNDTLKKLAGLFNVTIDELSGYNCFETKAKEILTPNKNTVIILGRDNSGRTEYTITDQQRKAIQVILETYKDIPDDDNF